MWISSALGISSHTVCSNKFSSKAEVYIFSGIDDEIAYDGAPTAKRHGRW